MKQLGISGIGITAKRPTLNLKKQTPKPVKKQVKNTKKETKKVEVKKAQNKKQQKKKQQLKPQTESQQKQLNLKQKQIVLQKAEQKPVQQAKPDIIRPILVRYSHYKTKFDAVNDYLKWSQIDEQYSISYVFKGNYIPKLKDPVTKQYMPRHQEGWLLPGGEYNLEVDEDEEEEAKIDRKPYVAPKQEKTCPFKKKGRDLITEELKKLSIEEIQGKSEKYRRLLEQRDLEDVLY